MEPGRRQFSQISGHHLAGRETKLTIRVTAMTSHAYTINWVRITERESSVMSRIAELQQSFGIVLASRSTTALSNVSSNVSPLPRTLDFNNTRNVSVMQLLGTLLVLKKD
jgi:hypothetical protein